MKTILSDELLDELNNRVEDIGSVILSRLVQDGIHVTFKDSQSALKAMQLGFVQVFFYLCVCGDYINFFSSLLYYNEYSIYFY